MARIVDIYRVEGTHGAGGGGTLVLNPEAIFRTGSMVVIKKMKIGFLTMRRILNPNRSVPSGHRQRR